VSLKKLLSQRYQKKGNESSKAIPLGQALLGFASREKPIGVVLSRRFMASQKVQRNGFPKLLLQGFHIQVFCFWGCLKKHPMKETLPKTLLPNPREEA